MIRTRSILHSLARSSMHPLRGWPMPALASTLALGLVLLAAHGTPAGAGERLVLTGSSTVAPIALEIGKLFEKQNPGVRVDVQTGGSSRGIRDVRQGTADIGMVSRSLKAEEADLTPHTIALDGLAMIVHRDNPVASLTRNQVVAIFTGRITDWNAVSARQGPITVVSKAEGRATLELFLDYFGLRPTDIRARVIIGDNEQGIKTVAGNPGAIAYVSVGAAAYQMARGVAIRMPALDGVVPTPQSVAAGTFPIMRQLNLVTRGDIPRLAARFIAFARSPAVRGILARFNVVAPAGKAS